jgi:hypothetical protein
MNKYQPCASCNSYTYINLITDGLCTYCSKASSYRIRAFNMKFDQDKRMIAKEEVELCVYAFLLNGYNVEVYSELTDELLAGTFFAGNPLPEFVI